MAKKTASASASAAPASQRTFNVVVIGAGAIGYDHRCSLQ